MVRSKNGSPSHSESNTIASPEENHYSVAAAVLPENIRKNRYIDVLPYDRTRVRVRLVGTGDDAYLNANWVREKYGRKLWIASQAALQNTSYTFLNMLLDDGGAIAPSPSPSTPGSVTSTSTSATTHFPHPRTVVQLTQNIESGRRKAHPYFPDVVGQTMIITPDPSEHTRNSSASATPRALKVTLLAQEHIREACCVKSVVEARPIANDIDEEDEYGDDDSASPAKRTSRPTIFTHLLFHAWPDHSVPSPSDRAALFEFVRLVDKVNRAPARRNDSNDSSDDSDDPPIIVGCSAGIGRTGSFIAMNSLLRHAGFLLPPADRHGASKSTSTASKPTSTDDSGPLPPLPQHLANDLIAQEIDSLREQRPGMVQRPEQAVLVYEMMVGAYVERR
ncbi:hypothetical protein GYMLUDRAFT_148439 [Collybiopsis luxurians FD-317 M1]|nr:hypothetical protein GYMLUDRAFT_148439 [Collybiopsis luxurians FD-317 M1]